VSQLRNKNTDLLRLDRDVAVLNKPCEFLSHFQSIFNQFIVVLTVEPFLLLINVLTFYP
jgi:hypothetical protein